uniref:HopJ type III effector protein n=1 Tax=Thaumasiovibrio occultus TaxID=1891184 RepID=UPI000B3604C7|nr:HopJ type III effector protein [Thaumasiovibrio occultus]
MSETFMSTLRNNPDKIEFNDVINYIEEHFIYTPTKFSNGVDDDRIVNPAGTNEGSCKIFAFAKLEGLTEEQTLACFGRFYRDDVLADPEGDNHANIRTFMRHGWTGIDFEANALADSEQ